MKRIAIAFCLLLFLALPLHAQEYDYCAGAGGAAALTCSETTQQAPTDMVTDGGSGTSFGKGSTTDWIASRFQYGGATGTTFCKIYNNIIKTGSLAGKSLYAYIYNDDGEATPHPSTEFSPCGYIDANTVADSDAWVGFSCTGVNTATNGAYYWVVMELRTAGDASNYITWNLDSSCATERVDIGSGSSWSNSSSAACGMLKLYILE